MNSLKMKIAVIFGVGQMSMGILLKGSNTLYFRNWMEFFFEFIPQILVLLALFGWMDYLIIIKWLTDWTGNEGNAPSVITTMIDMSLNGGVNSTPGDLPIVGTADEQTSIENILMIIVLICVPIMLCVKPIVVSLTAPKHVEEAHGAVAVHDDNQAPGGNGDFVRMESIKGVQSDEFDLHSSIVASFGPCDGAHTAFGELMIHQMIETIEFVLGTISNTASYLRLWALSLAHGQLSKVFFDMCLMDGLVSGDFLMMFLGFFAFIGASMGVLMCMDLLECCLHTLRLHWVEFQSKFFKGGGIPFTPVDLRQIQNQ